MNEQMLQAPTGADWSEAESRVNNPLWARNHASAVGCLHIISAGDHRSHCGRKLLGVVPVVLCPHQHSPEAASLAVETLNVSSLCWQQH